MQAFIETIKKAWSRIEEPTNNDQLIKTIDDIIYTPFFTLGIPFKRPDRKQTVRK